MGKEMMTMKTFLAALVSLLSCNCGQSGPDYMLAEQVQLVPDACVLAGLDGQATQVLADSIAAWNAQGAHFTLAPAAQQLQVVCVAPSDLTNTKALGEYDGRVVLNSGWWAHVTPGNSNLDYEDLVVHELGHALGLGHVADPAAAMFYASHAFHGLQPDDLADLAAAQ